MDIQGQTWIPRQRRNLTQTHTHTQINTHTFEIENYENTLLFLHSFSRTNNAIFCCWKFEKHCWAISWEIFKIHHLYYFLFFTHTLRSKLSKSDRHTGTLIPTPIHTHTDRQKQTHKSTHPPSDRHIHSHRQRYTQTNIDTQTHSHTHKRKHITYAGFCPRRNDETAKISWFLFQNWWISKKS